MRCSLFCAGPGSKERGWKKCNRTEAPGAATTPPDEGTNPHSSANKDEDTVVQQRYLLPKLSFPTQ